MKGTKNNKFMKNTTTKQKIMNIKRLISTFDELQNISPDFKSFVKKHESLTTEEIRKLYNI